MDPEAINAEIGRKRELLKELKNNLHDLEMKEAKFGGLYVPYYIKAEIRDLKEQIKALEQEIEQLQQSAYQAPPAQANQATQQSAHQAPSTQANHPDQASGVDVAILTVLPEEYWPIRNQLVNPRPTPSSASNPNLYSWTMGSIPTAAGGPAYTVVLGMQGRAGTTSGALATMEAVNQWHPHYVFFVGIAGGFDLNGLAKGDVVIADVIYGYEYGKLEEKFIPRHDWVFHADQGLLNGAKVFASHPQHWAKNIQVAPDRRPPKAIPGPIASGDKVVDNPTNAFFTEVRKTWPKLQAVEMEGAGAAAAIEQARDRRVAVGFLMIRGISDMPRPPQPAEGTGADVRGTQERDTWKKQAAEAAAEFTVGFIAAGLPIPPGASTGRATPAPTAQTSQPKEELMVDKTELRRRMLRKFDDERLRLLCDDINTRLERAGSDVRVSPAIVGGRGLEIIIANLIDYLDRRGLLSFLLDAVRSEEPGII